MLQTVGTTEGNQPREGHKILISFQGTGRAAQDTGELEGLAVSLPSADQLGLQRIME